MSTQVAIRLFGDVQFATVAQTPAFPNGEAGGLPLREVWSASTQLCPGPGCKVLVSGGVYARPATTHLPLGVNADNARWTSMLPVKLSVGSLENTSQRRIIDSDRQIVVDGDACISILAPSTWTEAEQLGESSVEVGVWVRACPVTCCYPPLPVVSWYAELTAVDATRIFVRPRGARRLRTTAPAMTTRVDWFAGDAAAGSQPVGVDALPLPNGQAIENIGAADELQYNPAAGVGLVMMVWDIEA